MGAISQGLGNLWASTGIVGFISPGGWANAVMILVGFLLLYLGIKKGFERF